MFDPRDPATIGYHLFFVLKGELGERFSTVIKSLAAENGGPVFDPHLTLLARIEGTESDVRARTGKLAGMLKPFTITAGSIAKEDAFFRALYLLAIPSPELSNARAKTLEVFDRNDSSYLPHFSLFYGNVSDEEKSTMEASITESLTFGFLVDRVYLYDTPGITETWKCIGEYPFST